jgi:hypothetical protein
MSTGQNKTLKARYRFSQWKHAGEEGEQLFIKNFRVTGDELPNDLISKRAAKLTPGSRVTSSTWSSPAGSDEPPITVDVLEYPSSDEAKESLLELTGQFHRPVELDVQTGDVGDVRIATPDGAWFAFIRGNVLVRIVAINGQKTPTRPVAEQIDSTLISKPTTPVPPTPVQPTPMPTTREFSSSLEHAIPTAATVKAALDLPLEDADLPEEEQPYIKIFSKGGTVKLENGSIVVPETAAEIEVFQSEPEKPWKRTEFPGNATPQPEN